jgi:hypothetical protein
MLLQPLLSLPFIALLAARAVNILRAPSMIDARGRARGPDLVTIANSALAAVPGFS